MRREHRGFVTPGRLALGVVLLVGLILSVRRFALGLGATTHLSDTTPWGFWIAFDVISGVALAAGGFTLALLAHIVGDRELRPVVRPAILTAFLGYLLVIAGVLFDLGKPWNIWHAIFWWNPHSAMLEVAWCVMLYTTVLFLEFLPMVCERFRAQAALRVIRAVEIPVFIAGILLSTLHQSSLGTLFLLVPTKLHPLWYTQYLPILFFFSAVTVGIAMVMVESTLSARFFKRGLELSALARLGQYLVAADLLYLALRVQDLTRRGVWPRAVDGSLESVAFLLEMLLFLAPLVLLLGARLRRHPGILFACGLAVVLGLVVNRLNVALVGMARAAGGGYFPSWQELWISATLVLAGVLAFGLAARYLPVFPPPEPADRPLTGESRPGEATG